MFIVEGDTHAASQYFNFRGVMVTGGYTHPYTKQFYRNRGDRLGEELPKPAAPDPRK
jgi:hypothetical protein